MILKFKPIQITRHFLDFRLFDIHYSVRRQILIQSLFDICYSVRRQILIHNRGRSWEQLYSQFNLYVAEGVIQHRIMMPESVQSCIITVIHVPGFIMFLKAL